MYCKSVTSFSTLRSSARDLQSMSPSSLCPIIVSFWCQSRKRENIAQSKERDSPTGKMSHSFVCSLSFTLSLDWLIGVIKALNFVLILARRIFVFRHFAGINPLFGLLSFDGCYSQTEESAERSVRATSGARAADHGLARFNPVYSVWFTYLLKNIFINFFSFLWRNLWQNLGILFGVIQ